MTVTVDVNSIVQHVLQIKNGKMANVNMSAKIIAPAKRVIVGILAHGSVGTVGILP